MQGEQRQVKAELVSPQVSQMNSSSRWGGGEEESEGVVRVRSMVNLQRKAEARAVEEDAAGSGSV